MAHAHCNLWELSLAVTQRENKIDIDFGQSAEGYVSMSCAEAVKLRDDLSRAILEAATASAKAVQAEGAQP